MSADQLPPVDSLWRHRETGEQRLVLTSLPPELEDKPIEFVGNNRILRSCSVADWLAWQANAERIDKETTNGS